MVMATGMHLDPRYGMTVSEIEADGFSPLRVGSAGEAPDDVCERDAAVMAAFGRSLDYVCPDALVILGDRTEMLAVAAAATVRGVPLIHIAGGTLSEGAVDDNVRHALTKLSVLHLVETDRCRSRVVAMGEDPSSVVTAGSLGVENILSTPRMSRSALEENLGWCFGGRNILATLHAETRGAVSPLEAMRAFLAALGDVMDEYAGLNVLMTYPNNDVPSAPQIAAMREFEAASGGRMLTIPSLGRVRYMSALDVVDAVAGNSSGGIVEVLSAGVPVLDVGDRQKGRERGPAVWHCGTGRAEVACGLRTVLSRGARALAADRVNPYSRPGTAALMADTILGFGFRPFQPKKFYEK